MSQPHMQAAPVLSTPDAHVFEDPSPAIHVDSLPRLSDEQLYLTYEIDRTVREIREGRWRRIALQFPDEMLVDAPRVYQSLVRGLHGKKDGQPLQAVGEGTDSVANGMASIDLQGSEGVKLSILGDTSYGSCCVDEIAAEHVDADVVVHYGRSCLSPTSRLPVIYVFTTPPLDIASVITTFTQTYPDHDRKVILMADVPYCSYIAQIQEPLKEQGYTALFATEIVHDPSSLLPNRTVPDEVKSDPTHLRDYALFHIAQPPTALLLTLSSRLSDIHIFPTNTNINKALQASTAQSLLRRRYAIITSLSTTAIWGILINTLSVKNYLHIVDHVKAQVAAAGKKSYTFVVGKINPAKIANFSEIGGWIVIGCWESSLVENKEFYRPVITPFELELALQGDQERVWTGEWRSDFQGLLDKEKDQPIEQIVVDGDNEAAPLDSNGDGLSAEYMDSEEESAPPEYDLRTGRYISHTRPMRVANAKADTTTSIMSNGTSQTSKAPSNSLVKRANGEIAAVGGIASPGADFLRSQRTWQGLGSDYEIDFTTGAGREGALVEQGRSGVARGYTVGETEPERR